MHVDSKYQKQNEIVLLALYKKGIAKRIFFFGPFFFFDDLQLRISSICQVFLRYRVRKHNAEVIVPIYDGTVKDLTCNFASGLTVYVTVTVKQEVKLLYPR